MSEKTLRILKAKACYGHLGGMLGGRLFEPPLEQGWFEQDGDKTTVYFGKQAFQGITHCLSRAGSLWKLIRRKKVFILKTCISCGMPMTKPPDYPLADESKDYCIYCARPDGSMQSYPEKLEGTTEFLIRTQGLDKDAAHQIAIRTLAKLPAWKGKENNIE